MVDVSTTAGLQQQIANLDAAYGGPSDKDPLTVPNRNTTPTAPTANSFNDFTATTNNYTTSSDVLSPSTSNFQSQQLPAFSGSIPVYSESQINTPHDINDPAFQPVGYTAASDTSYSASTNFTNLSNSQTGSPGADGIAWNSPTSPGAASPVDGASLQSSGNIFNNAFATLSGPGTLTTNNFNNINQNADQWDRVKLRFAPAHPLASYPTGSMLHPLAATTGLVWLYKPSVSISSNVEYESMNLVHSISEVHSFVANRAPTITVSGPVISQTVDDAMYALACIHFLQSVSKMAFGNTGLSNTQTLNTLGASATIPTGSPPPVILLSGYGQAMFNDIPVIVTSFGLDLPADVDYIEVPTGPGAGTKIPVSFMLQVSLTVQRSTANMRGFNIDTFSRYGIKSWW